MLLTHELSDLDLPVSFQYSLCILLHEINAGTNRMGKNINDCKVNAVLQNTR